MFVENDYIRQVEYGGWTATWPGSITYGWLDSNKWSDKGIVAWKYMLKCDGVINIGSGEIWMKI